MMMRTWLGRTSVWWRRAAVITALMIAVPASAEDKQSVVEEILRILRAGGQITTEQEQALRDRAKQEESGRFIAGIDAKTLKPYLGSADGNYRIELGGFVQFDYDAAESGERQPTGQQIVSEFLVRRARLNMTGDFFKWASRSRATSPRARA